jgi:hypothetical protein
MFDRIATIIRDILSEPGPWRHIVVGSVRCYFVAIFRNRLGHEEQSRRWTALQAS